MAGKMKKSGSGMHLRSMLHVDLRRMFTTSLLYIMVASAFVIPVLVMVMTTMMDGTVSVNPQTGVETVIEAFDSVWQIIGITSGAGSAMDMSITGMCNINLVYFLVSVFICLFVSEDFRSGYAKNLFTVRADKTDYVISKTLTGFIAGSFMLLGFFAGAILGGMFSGLPFDMGDATVGSIVMCMLAKIALMAVFVSIYLVLSVFAKQKSWLSILLSMMCGMFLFMMIPILTPLDATIINVIVCLAGGALFSISLGIAGKTILNRRDIL